MKVLKKSLSILLMVVLMLTMVPWSSMTVEAAGLSLAQLQEKFPDGKYWNHSNGGSSNNNPDGWTSSPCSSCHGRGTCGTASDCRCNKFDGGVQCYGFAFKLAYDYYGSYASSWPTKYSVDSLKAGDVVRYKNNGHSIWVTAVNGDTVTYADCNSDTYGNTCIIRWNKTISKSTLASTLSWVKSAPYALTPDPPEVDTRYPTPFYAYTLSTSNVDCYNGINGSRVGSIYFDDLCTIQEIYTNGWCKLSCPWPSDANGYKIVYAPVNIFLQSGRDTFISEYINGASYSIYTKSNLQSVMTSRETGAPLPLSGGTFYKVGQSGSYSQIIYSTSSGMYCGWLDHKVDPPQNIQLSVTPGTSATATTFRWTTYNYVASANIRILKGSEDYSIWGATTNTVSTILPAGTYNAYVDVFDFYDSACFGSTYGNGIYFTVSQAQTYTVSYNANGGSGAPSSQTKTHGVDLALSKTVPTGKSYTISFNGNGGTVTTSEQQVSEKFAAWNTKVDGSGTAYTAGGTYSANAGATLYAQWNSAVLGSVPNPTRDGYYFVGWYDSTAVNGSGEPTGNKYSDTSAIKSDITLYAMWVPADTLYYGDVNRDGLVDSMDVTLINRYILGNHTPEYDLNEFLLRADLNRDGTITDEDTVIVNSHRLHKLTQADLAASYTGTEISVYPKLEYKYGESLDVENLAIRLSFAEGSSYEIKNGLSVSGYNSKTTGKQTISIKFYQYITTYEVTVKPLQYTVSYNANGGTGAPSPQVKINGEILVLSNTKPTRTGYDFMGWATSSTATSATYQPGGTYTNNSAVTLYAVWKPHSYTYSVTKTPTTAATGTLTGTCSRCSGTTTITLPKLDTTNYTYSVVKAATCTAAGTGRYTWKTTEYGVRTFDMPISALGHNYNAVVTAPTASEQGYTTYTCKKCSDHYVSDYIDPIGVQILTQPKSVKVAEGETAKVTLKAEGKGLTYTWYYKNAGASGFSKTSSFSGTSYYVAMNEERDGRQIYCVIKDTYGNTAKSNTVTISMEKYASVVTQPKTTYTQSGATAKTTVKATGDGLTYQWYIKNYGATKYSKSSITNATYSCKMSSASKDRLAYCIVTDQYGNSVKADTVRLRMAATITTQPKSVKVASGSVAKTTVTAVGDGLTYTWYIKNPGKTSFAKSSVTGAAYSCKMSSSVNGRQAYCVVTDKYGKTAKSNTVTLSMK